MEDSHGHNYNTPSSIEALESLPSFEFLEKDPRPTFLFDLQGSLTNETHRLRPVFRNASLKYQADLTRLASGQIESSSRPDEQEFVQWALEQTEHTFLHKGFRWVSFTLRKRWRIISGTEDTKASSHAVIHRNKPSSSPDPEAVAQGHRLTGIGGPHHAWTDTLSDSPHVDMFRRTNWSETALGPLESWPDLLRHMTQFLMADSRAACLFWWILFPS